MKFIIKLFPEIMVKSRPVRKQLTTAVRRNITKGLYEYFDDFCEYKSLKQNPSDSVESYLRLCEAHKCLKANVVLLGFSQKEVRGLFESVN